MSFTKKLHRLTTIAGSKLLIPGDGKAGTVEREAGQNALGLFQPGDP